MLFHAPDLDLEDVEVIAQLADRRDRLADQLRQPRRWTGVLRRNLTAKAIQGSNSIEGYVVETDDAAAAIEGLDALSADELTFAEIRGYRLALGYVLNLAADGGAISVETIKALHFMLLNHDLSKSPGQFRDGAIYVRDERTGDAVYTGPDGDLVPALVEEFVTTATPDVDPYVDAAMAHLNFVMIHPFRDGNGRMARALQALQLARRGIGEPAFASIEEWLGANTPDYYQVLAHTGGGAWHPERDTHLWIKFNLRAHHMQSQTLERRVRRSELLWQELEAIIAATKMPDRTFDALFESALGYRLRRSNYAAQADVPEQTATRDLKALADADLLTPHGEKRGRFYTAGPVVLQARQRVVDQLDVPVTEPYPNFRARLAMDVT